MGDIYLGGCGTVDSKSSKLTALLASGRTPRYLLGSLGLTCKRTVEEVLFLFASATHDEHEGFDGM